MKIRTIEKLLVANGGEITDVYITENTIVEQEDLILEFKPIQ